ncbi:biotin transporter BioY [Sinisalibacter aestuarii]|uniref:Biotin transporter n=1 Tax=Sinisalibacter aestuarii TaxID=2949426 RepID=A0ABQ5LYT8_9RHOB|nr:biotin transporter BioY [Sinisalibacter aestuarii]GKY90135.1 biotin transporter BioY [Sinisalibacter aestuarii]
MIPARSPALASRLSTRAALALAGSALLALSARVTVPLWPVEVSLQTFAVLLIASAFGMRLGLATMALYLAEGALGLPVFQGTPEKGLGLAYMAGPTGGYLAGFVVATAIVGWAADRGWGRNPLRIGAAMLAGELALLALGAAWLAVLFGPAQAFAYGVGPFILGDIQKLALAALLAPVALRLLASMHLR